MGRQQKPPAGIREINTASYTWNSLYLSPSLELFLQSCKGIPVLIFLSKIGVLEP
jgi:hypothetical protein